MKTFAMLAGSGLLLFAAPAIAQEISAGGAASGAVPGAAVRAMPDTPATPDSTPDTGAAAGTTADPSVQTFTDAQISGFVAAMTAIQALPGDNAAKQTQAVQIVADAGIDAATYNAIGEALQTDPALADRVRTAMAASPADPDA